MEITKLPKQWIEENKHYKRYYFIKNNEIFYNEYDKELNEFAVKNQRSSWSIKEYLYYINTYNNYWYKSIRPIIIKALKEEEFNEFIKSLE